jgi:hypothetical protein
MSLKESWMISFAMHCDVVSNFMAVVEDVPNFTGK